MSDIDTHNPVDGMQTRQTIRRHKLRDAADDARAQGTRAAKLEVIEAAEVQFLVVPTRESTPLAGDGTLGSNTLGLARRQLSPHLEALDDLGYISDGSGGTLYGDNFLARDVSPAGASDLADLLFDGNNSDAESDGHAPHQPWVVPSPTPDSSDSDADTGEGHARHHPHYVSPHVEDVLDEEEEEDSSNEGEFFEVAEDDLLLKTFWLLTTLTNPPMLLGTSPAPSAKTRYYAAHTSRHSLQLPFMELLTLWFTTCWMANNKT
ncbi:hypothetical protein VTO73DRAFT_4451 [Trametes versicolor]